MDGTAGVGQPQSERIEDPTGVSFDASTIVTRHEYDGEGNETLTTDPGGGTVTREYDGAGRLAEARLNAVTIHNGGYDPPEIVTPITTYQYDPAGNLEITLDPRLVKTETSYDARNRPVKTILDLDRDGVCEENGDDVVTSKAYDLAGNVTVVTDARGHTTDTKYDRAFRPYELKQPEVDVFNPADPDTPTRHRPVTLTEYDKNSSVIEITDPEGVVTETVYDEWNRPTDSYAAKGTAEEVRTESEYDPGGNLLAVTLHNEVNGEPRPQRTEYEYDSFDRRTKETLPDPDPDDQVDERPTSLIEYYWNGAIKQQTDPNEQLTQHEYDRNARTTETEFSKPDGQGGYDVTETRTFAYYKTGNIDTATDAQGTTTYLYDELHRLKQETKSSPQHPGYTTDTLYDEVSNRTSIASHKSCP